MIIFIMKVQAETEYQTLHDGQRKMGTKLRKFREEQDLAFFPVLQVFLNWKCIIFI